MDFKKLSSSKISDAIDAQWRANLAVDRIRIANGQSGSGLTSFLRFLDGAGAIFTILFSILIIIGIVIYKIFGFILALFITPSGSNANAGKSDLNIGEELVDVTEEEEAEIVDSIRNEHREISIAEWQKLSGLLSSNGYSVVDDLPDFFLRDYGFIYSSQKEELILANWHLIQSEDQSWYIAWDSGFRLISMSNEKVMHFYDLDSRPDGAEDWNEAIKKSTDKGVEVDFSNYELEDLEFSDLLNYLKQ